MNPKEFWSFRTMITPVFIQVLFWIGVGMCVLLGLAGIIGGASSDYGGGGRQVLGGVLTILVGPILVRVYCELILVAFRIYDVLIEIRDGRRGDAPATAAPDQPAP